MLFPDTEHPWEAKPLGELFSLSLKGINPENFPREEFHLYSIPAWDELGGPVVSLGMAIDSGKLLLEDECILISKLNPQIPRVRSFDPPRDGRRACASTEIMPFVPRDLNATIGFFKHYFLSDRFRKNLVSAATGTTNSHKRVRPPQTLQWLIPAPKPDEQAAIASVLDAADAAIDRARDAVEKAQTTRLALIQAAFNYEMTSETRHDTDAGRIPQSWEALKGKQAFSVLTGGNSSVYALKPLRGDDVADAWFMKVDDFNLPANLRQIVTTQIGFVCSKNPSFKLLPVGTIIIAKRGAAILKNRVRTTAVPIALDPNLMALKVRDDILPEFFRYQLEWRNLTRYVESSGVPQLNNKDLYPRWFVRAPENQQKDIVAVISAAEQHEDALRSKLNALEALKKSLMHDLLTGTMRVDPALFKEQQ